MQSPIGQIQCALQLHANPTVRTSPYRLPKKETCSTAVQVYEKRTREMALEIGRRPMQTVEEFLAYSIHLEQEAAARFGELADAMESGGNKEVSKLFRRLSDYSKLHLADAKARAGFRKIPEIAPHEFVWPDLESPEAAAIWGADPMISRSEALEIALAAETAGYQYYKHVLDTTVDPEIKALAKEFVAEEADHVTELHKWIAAAKAGLEAPAN
jgi:rubrerythrin